MIAFTADYQSGEVKVDGIEIDQAGFFTKDNIPGIPPTNFSIASKMIEEFIHGKT
jgi:NAD+ diphosphatase